MSEIVIRHIEPSDAEALRDIMSHPDVYHDTLQLPHALWKCGTNALRQNQAGAISLPVWTSALLDIWHWT